MHIRHRLKSCSYSDHHDPDNLAGRDIVADRQRTPFVQSHKETNITPEENETEESFPTRYHKHRLKSSRSEGVEKSSPFKLQIQE
ncbi:hypothetical protein AVEN_72275-1 [Araneus ventricosus]|uniref:Uncharacterized protein n=1 Tax=Araneus ventricosus TaxID=182803 RepID=A0A4Y2RBK9_ARAVE|nr:hypothetical protein AVEN_72275-1 [Araneus ventricosus]